MIPPGWRCWRTLLLFLVAAAAAGCYATSPSAGGGQTRKDTPRQINPADVALPPGYRIEVVASELTFPSAVTFDGQGWPCVLEAGYSYGDVWTTPRLLRVEPGGVTSEIARGENGPWTGVTFHEGAFYVAEGGHRDGGRILRVGTDGKTTALLEGLPSLGDHHTNGPRVGPDGMLYFGQGTATNSGVVGADAAEFGWLQRHPDFHDVPAHDVKLAGQNFTTQHPLRKEKEKVITGAYLPFGTPSTPGQVIPGRVPCTGAVMRIPTEGGKPEIVAWGLRNPYGLAWSPGGQLYVTENSYDVRGSRPVWGTGDLLWAIRPGTWYGWPDFHGGVPLTEADHFTAPGMPSPQFLLAEHPNAPPQPAAKLGVHSSSNGIDFAPEGAFGFTGEAFIAQFGDMAPAVGKVIAPVGYKVVRVDVNTGVIHDFAANRGKENGPASKLGKGGFERPTDVRFDPNGDALYVVDFGVMTVGKGGPQPRQGTGVLWRITREAGR